MAENQLERGVDILSKRLRALHQVRLSLAGFFAGTGAAGVLTNGATRHTFQLAYKVCRFNDSEVRQLDFAAAAALAPPRLTNHLRRVYVMA